LRITEPGRDALHQWLQEPTDAPTEIRDLGLLKLFLSGDSDERARRTLARQQLASHMDRLELYRSIRAEFPHGARDPSHATLELGLAFEQAAIDFWTRIADDSER
jgi:hypothetical protein